MALRMYQVDAFASQPFGGNPAAICSLEKCLPEAVMQAVTAENNLSETAFFVPRNGGDDASFDLRWFTPTTEAEMCGHATLGAARIIFSKVRPDARHIDFHTPSGRLGVAREDDVPTMDLPSSPLAPSELRDIASCVGARPAATLRSMYGLAVFGSADHIRLMEPDFDRIAELDCDALIVSAPGDRGSGVDFISRVFAPKVGIPEDPVTGSAHCVLTPYWSRRLGKRHLFARQVSKRGGEIDCRDLGDRVRIAGHVAPYLEGTLQL